MNKGFKSKKKRKRKGRILFFFVIFLLGFIMTFNYFDNNFSKISDKRLVRLLLNCSLCAVHKRGNQYENIL